MRHQPLYGTQFFFATTSLPCPYITGQVERRVVTELVGRDASRLHDQLSLAGFRRSHSIVYAPACPTCQACIPVRILVPEFQLSRSQRRVETKNRDVYGVEVSASATMEQFELFSAYQQARHGHGDMAKMDFMEFQALIEETPIDTFVVEFRTQDERLIAVMLADRVDDGLSAVYSFFDPDESSRSLGTYMVLWLIKNADLIRLGYVYLGFWVKNSQKMAYKATFLPLEKYTPNGWTRMDMKDIK
jgi:arginyl-tRNA--protein-N-Asp/Glu arginylyltransferase